MDFLFVNTQELSALIGLPYLQQVTYLLGIRPYMDRKTFIVGLKRRISYQSLSEALYVEPHQGIQSGSPSRQQLRRVVSGLQRAGLVSIQSSDKHLILKCLLANTDNSLQNKADTNPTPYPNTKPVIKNVDKSVDYDNKNQKPGIGQIAKSDIPHNSENNYVCVWPFRKILGVVPQKNRKEKSMGRVSGASTDRGIGHPNAECFATAHRHRPVIASSGPLDAKMEISSQLVSPALLGR